MKVKKVNHIGIVVRNLEEVIALYRDEMGLPLAWIEDVPEQGVRIAFLPVGETEIELLEPLDPESGVASYLEKRGESVHHLCFEVEDLDRALDELAAQGVRLIDEKPRMGNHGQKLAFLHPKSTHGVLIELYETQ